VAGGVSALNVEDSSIANKLITTRNVVNSCGLTSARRPDKVRAMAEILRLSIGVRNWVSLLKTYPV
jgi:hypothetical protein